ncbi:MAG: peptidoglycan editing factor PgeF [Frankia sp.]
MPTRLTDRRGGLSRAPFATFNLGDHVGDDPAAVAANRRRLAGSLSVGSPSAVQYMRQVHSDTVAVIRTPGAPPEADALVTDQPGLALAVLVADCVPVLFTAPTVVAVAHAGRRGTQAGVVPATLAAMERLGARPADVTVTLGPAVCGDCYEVPAAMRAEVAAAVPATWATSRAGTPALDLRAGLAEQLTAARVGRIVVDERCTAQDDELFSYRRDGETGRFAGLAWLA